MLHTTAAAQLPDVAQNSRSPVAGICTAGGTRLWRRPDCPSASPVPSVDPPPVPSIAPLQLLGFARATSDGALSAVIWDVSVAPAWQRSGLGRAMMERLTASLVHDGIATITLYAGGSCARRAAGCSAMLTSLPVAAAGVVIVLPQALPITPHPPALLPSRAQRGGPVREAGLCGRPGWSAGRGLPAVEAGAGPRLRPAGSAMSLQGIPVS